MDERARAGWLLLGAVVVGAGVWALRGESERPRPHLAPVNDAAVAPVEAPQQPATPPPTLRPTPPPSMAPTPFVVPPGKPDSRCPSGVWVDEDLSHDGGGRGCLAASGDGGALREGWWSLHTPDGNLTSGEFVHGVREGRWIATYPNGRQAWEVRFVGGAREGTQIDWSPEGAKVAEHTYRAGALDGPATITYPDGRVVHEVWRNGVRVDLPAASAADTP